MNASTSPTVVNSGQDFPRGDVNGTTRAYDYDEFGSLPAILEHAYVNQSGPFRTAIVYGTPPLIGLADQAVALRKAGWWIMPATLSTWTVCRRDGLEISLGLANAHKPGIHDGLYPVGAGRHQDGPPTIDRAEVLRRLDMYHRYTGRPWHGTPALSAMAQVVAAARNRTNVVWRSRGPSIAADAGHALTWRAPDPTAQPAWPHTHTWDGTKAYLGAASMAQVAAQQLTRRVGPQMFDKALAGWWRIDTPNAVIAAVRAGRPAPARIGRDGTITATTALIGYIEQTYGTVDVIESWTAPASRLFRPWAEHLRDVITVATSRGDVPLVQALKATYRTLVGGMSRKGMPIERPDWTAAIIDQWRATLLRRIDRVEAETGLYPIRIQTDSLTYVTDRPETISAVLVGPAGRPGAMRYTGSDVGGTDL